MIPLSILAAIIIIPLVVVLLFPSPIHAAMWILPQAPAWEGPFKPNHDLSSAELLGQGQLRHPEDIAFDKDDCLYTGCEDGKIYRLHLDARGSVLKIETFAETGG
jgi:Adipocyte plasma membrane-associated protein-like, N-terminal